MESACLRIRFTPLLKNIHRNNSKCCLEIVPEVSYLQNFENIQWRQGDNSIEYTIPVTYKVVLKKKEIVKSSDNDLENKTYHSCVDLLMPSSLTNLNLGSGDISKIISDTLMLSKLSTEFNKSNVILSEKSNSITVKSEDVEDTQSQKDKKEKMQIIVSSVGLLEKKDINETIYTNMEKKDFKDESSQVVHIVDATSDCHSKISLINSESLLRNRYTSTDIISYMATIDKLSSYGSKDDTKHKLSLTPICSINTEDKALDNVRNMTSNFFVLRVNEPKILNVISMENMYKSGRIMYKKCPTDVTNDLNLDTLRHKANKRILPEVRIAHFVQIMNQEILPLKIMLNDILRKCSSLGLTWKEKDPINYKIYNSIDEIYKNVSTRRTEKEKCCKKEYKCNRVVYSMVFND